MSRRLRAWFWTPVLGVLLLSLSLLVPATSARADTIYAATGAENPAGILYTLDETTGLATPVGALVDSADNPYALTALAFDPVSGTLYGGTSRNSATDPSSLVTVDPLTGLVTLVGEYGLVDGNRVADLAFAADGTLYGWEAAGNHQLVTIDPATGAATVVPGAPVFLGFGGGGLAFDLGGTLYVTPDGNTTPTGTLRTVNPANGAFITTVALSGSPIIGKNAINAMDVSSGDILYGINEDFFQPSGGLQLAHLVTINKVTGAITDIGSTGVNGLDAIAIQIQSVPEPASIALLGVGMLAFAFLRRRRR